MKYYEIRDYDAPIWSNFCDGYRTRVIDEDELDRRLLEIVHYDLEKSKQILLHGKVKEADPWDEWVHELSDALGYISTGSTTLRLEAALLKLKALVEKKD